MSIELESDPSVSDISCLLDWALQTGVWNGRQVSWINASEFQHEIHQRIIDLLQGEDPMRMAAQLARLGTPAPGQSLLAREIQEFDFSKSDLIVQVGLRKSVGKFWKKHRKEILIGAAILAVVTVVVIVSVSTVGTGTGAVAAAGGAALDAATDKEKKSPVKAPHRNEPIPTVKPELPSIALDPMLTNNKLIFGETGVLINGEYSSYQDLALNQWKPTATPYEFSSFPLSQFDEIQTALPAVLETPPETKPITPQNQSTWTTYFINNLGKDPDNLDLFELTPSLPSPEISSRFMIPGKVDSSEGVGGINGVLTKIGDAVAHAEYLAKLSNGHAIDWVYNRSHGPVVDLAEVFAMNYPGFSPNNSDLLQQTWRNFDRRNQGNPEAKYLQFCHSQGAIHVRNALENLPKEIRDRVIVIAIAPAAIVPRELCHDAYNYASKSDIVNYGELFWAASFDSNECRNSKKVEIVLELRDQLILLDPHPDATGIDHDFQSPTFREQIIKHLNEYISKKGKYT